MPEPQEIEVQVLETTDIARPRTPADQAPAGTSGKSGAFPDFRQWGGRVKTLDMRWWPLWLLLAIVATALIATLGVAALAFFLIGKFLRGVWRFLGGK